MFRFSGHLIPKPRLNFKVRKGLCLCVGFEGGGCALILKDPHLEGS